MLTGPVKAQIQAATRKALTDTCTLSRRAAGVGDYGEATQIFEDVATAVPCRVITIGNRFRELAGDPNADRDLGGGGTLARETLLDAYRLIVPAGTALDVDMRVTVTSSGEVYEIVDLVTERTDETDRQAIIVKAR